MSETDKAQVLALEPYAQGSAPLTLAGPLGDPPDYTASDFDVTMAGPDLHAFVSQYTAETQLTLVPGEAFTVQATLGIGSESLLIADVQVSIGTANLTGSATVVTDRVSFSIDAQLPNVAALNLPESRWQPDAVAAELRARGEWHGARWTIEEAHLAIGETTLDWSGVFDSSLDLSATDLNVVVNSPSVSQLGTLNGARLPDLPFILKAHFEGTDQGFVMDELRGTFGGTKFSGRLNVALNGQRPAVDAELEMDVLDLRDWYDDSQLNEAASTGSIIPDISLPIDQLGALDGNLQAKVKVVHFENITFTDGLLRAQLQDRALRVSDFDIVAPRGRIDGTLEILPDGDSADVHWTIDGQNLKFNIAGGAEDLADTMTWDVALDLRGRGVTTRELASSLNGRISILSPGGRVHNRGLSVIFTSFGKKLIDTLNPFNMAEPYSTITCAKFVFVAEDGLLRTDPALVLQTQRINLMSTGTIDLATEKIEFNLNSKPRKRLSISAGELINPYMRLVGTLSEPQITINQRGTAIAALTAGWSIVAQAAWDRTFRAKDPCSVTSSD